MCNAYGHPPECDCGWGGVYYPSVDRTATDGASIPAAGATSVWSQTDFCRPSSCPKCGKPVFFVRHNGGSVWFDALGIPWPKHPCMASEPDMTWLQRCLAEEIEPGNRKVFGVICEAKVGDPGISAFFRIRCSDGTVIEGEFVYSLDPCDAIGGLVTLELTPDNRVESRRFKAIHDMLEAHSAKLKAEERIKKMKEGRRKAQEARERETNEFIERMHEVRIRKAIKGPTRRD